MKKDLFLIIDMQNVYTEGGQWYCPGSKAAADHILEVLQASHKEVDILFTVFLASKEAEGVWKEYNAENAAVNEDPWSNALMSEFQEYQNLYPVYGKATYSSLSIPEVLEAAKQAKHVAVSGVVAECCVLSTVMALIDEGIPVIYLTDAVAGINKETEKSVELILSGLEPLHVRRMTTEQYLKEHF